jgi:hypothetical protein
MVILHWITRNSTTLGLLPGLSLRRNYVRTGLSQVISYLLVVLICTYSSVGCDEITQKRILEMLKANDHFRAQMADLVASKPVLIEVEEEMSYHS